MDCLALPLNGNQTKTKLIGSVIHSNELAENERNISCDSQTQVNAFGANVSMNALNHSTFIVQMCCTPSICSNDNTTCNEFTKISSVFDAVVTWFKNSRWNLLIERNEIINLKTRAMNVSQSVLDSKTKDT